MFLRAVGILSEIDEAVDETDFYLLETLPKMLVAEAVQLPYGLPKLRVQHVLHTILSPE